MEVFIIKNNSFVKCEAV